MKTRAIDDQKQIPEPTQAEVDEFNKRADEDAYSRLIEINTPEACHGKGCDQ